MKTLYLVRHAKSSWKEEKLHDMDRPLKGRGVRDAHNASQWLKEQNYIPELIVSSPATRAMHTALIFSKNLGISFRTIKIEEDIYGAAPKVLLQLVRNFSDDYKSVMLFGHNPTITDFVNRCLDHRINNVPTTGIACLRFNENKWSEIDKKAELVFFDYPKRHKLT